MEDYLESGYENQNDIFVKEKNCMINRDDLTARDIRRLARKPLGTNGKTVKISSDDIDKYKEHIENVLQCNCRRTYAEKILKANMVY